MNLTLGEIVRDHLSEKHGKKGFMILYLTKQLDVSCNSDQVWSDPIEAEKLASIRIGFTAAPRWRR